MKTRIKETTKVVDGQTVIMYQAQFHDFWKWFNWKPILGYHVYQVREGDWSTHHEDEVFKSDSERGTLQFCKDLIDYILNIEKQEQESQKRFKEIKNSAKVKYIRYP